MSETETRDAEAARYFKSGWDAAVREAFLRFDAGQAEDFRREQRATRGADSAGRRPVRLVQVDAETLRQLRSDKARYKSDRDDAWARCAAEECECVESARAELSHLRGVVEAVQALADDWAERVPQFPADAAIVGCGTRLRAALAPVSSWANAYADPDQAHDSISPAVSSSGEAESGERIEAFVELLPAGVGHNLRHFGPDAPHITGHDCACRPEPIPHAVPSGGQAGGEGEARDPVATVRAYLDETFGFYGDEEPDDELDRADGSEGADLRLSDLKALVALAARPVLSREALRARLDGHWPSRTGESCHCGEWEPDDVGYAEFIVQYLDHLADVLDGGQ